MFCLKISESSLHRLYRYHIKNYIYTHTSFLFDKYDHVAQLVQKLQNRHASKKHHASLYSWKGSAKSHANRHSFSNLLAHCPRWLVVVKPVSRLWPFSSSLESRCNGQSRASVVRIPPPEDHGFSKHVARKLSPLVRQKRICSSFFSDNSWTWKKSHLIFEQSITNNPSWIAKETPAIIWTKCNISGVLQPKMLISTYINYSSKVYKLTIWFLAMRTSLVS